MRILIPYAAWLPGAADDLPLPALHHLLSKMELSRQYLRPETAFYYFKHEADLAALHGLQGTDSGRLALTALQRQQTGLMPAAGESWGRISLCQWQIGMNDGQLRAPAQLSVTQEEAQALWQTLTPLLAERGLVMEAYPVLPPYARHVRVTGLFADLACARVERVAGLELRDYLPRAQAGTAQAAWQNLLAEVQMQLYQHPVNHAREARRQASLNSIWLDGVGALPAGFAPAQVDIIPDLQQAAERGDLAAWRNAWLHMEGERVPQWQAALDSGAALELHLCGLGQSAMFIPAERGLAAHVKRAWQRWRQAEPGVHWPSALAAPS